MTTRELIEKLKEIDSDGNCEVILNAWSDYTPATEVKKISRSDVDDDDNGKIITYCQIEIS